MWIYWLLFLIPATVSMVMPAVTDGRPAKRLAREEGARLAGWWAVAVVFTLAIGLRYQVGADWDSYEAQYLHAASLDLVDLLLQVDPGYVFFNWLSSVLGFGMTGANMMAAACFVVGLFTFCNTLPRPWLGLSIAVPYLVVVVAMGYTRQSVAIGMVLVAIAQLAQRKPFWFLFFVVLGSAFHRTALVLAPLAILSLNHGRALTTLTAVGLVGVGAYALLSEAFVVLYENYIVAGYESEGAFIRLLMCALPASILLSKSSRFRLPRGELALWRPFAWASLALFAVLLWAPYTTAIDRIALYLLPIQMAVFSRVPNAFGRAGGNNDGAVFAVLVYYAMVLFIWLNFATHAEWWVPYRSVITD